MSADAILSVSNLEKHFYEGKLKALSGITTEIQRGEVVCVIGPSGSGKSTFLRCLNLMELPTAGTITFEIDHITKDGDSYTATIDPVNVRELSKLAELGRLFEAANLWDPEVTLS